MDWFRRQRRAKKVTSDEEVPALPDPDKVEDEESDEAEIIAVPQPLQVELTPALPPPPSTLVIETSQPLRVELTSPLPGPVEIPQPLQVDVTGVDTLQVKLIPPDTDPK